MGRSFFDKLRDAWAGYLSGASGRFEGYRTHALAFLGFVLGILDVVDPYAITSVIPFQYQGYILAGYSILTFLLRQITNSASPLRFKHTRGTE